MIGAIKTGKFYGVPISTAYVFAPGDPFIFLTLKGLTDKVNAVYCEDRVAGEDFEMVYVSHDLWDQLETSTAFRLTGPNIDVHSIQFKRTYNSEIQILDESI